MANEQSGLEDLTYKVLYALQRGSGFNFAQVEKFGNEVYASYDDNQHLSIQLSEVTEGSGTYKVVFSNLDDSHLSLATKLADFLMSKDLGIYAFYLAGSYREHNEVMELFEKRVLLPYPEVIDPDFIRGRDKILAKFTPERSPIISPSERVKNGESGYQIALIIPDEVEDILAKASDLLHKLTDSLLYLPRELHITLATSQVLPGLEGLNRVNNIDSNLVKQLEERLNLVGNHIPVVRYVPPSITDLGIYVSKGTVLASGKPNSLFTGLGLTILGSNADGLLNRGWGNHATIARFIEEGDERQMAEVRALLSGIKVPDITATGISIDFYQMSKNGVLITQLESYPFPEFNKTTSPE